MMRLIFRKNKESEISVHKKSGDREIEFSYIDMIKEITKARKLDDADLEGDFSEAEKGSISSMVTHINDEVAAFYSDENDS